MFTKDSPKNKPPSRGPVWKTMYFTLEISARFLWRNWTGRYDHAYGDELMRGWARRIFKAGNASLDSEGIEKLDDAAYIFMSNHSSLLDIPAMFGTVPTTLRMVLKEELLRVPIWGTALRASGFIPVDRKNTKRAIEQLNVAKQQVADGVSVWISPEGTRSRDGTFGPFKKGGFHLAKQLEVPIVPVWIRGTDSIIPPDQFHVVYDGDAHVVYGDPIDTNIPLEELMVKVRAAMIELAGGAEHVIERAA